MDCSCSLLDLSVCWQWRISPLASRPRPWYHSDYIYFKKTRGRRSLLFILYILAHHLPFYGLLARILNFIVFFISNIDCSFSLFPLYLCVSARWYKQLNWQDMKIHLFHFIPVLGFSGSCSDISNHSPHVYTLYVCTYIIDNVNFFSTHDGRISFKHFHFQQHHHVIYEKSWSRRENVCKSYIYSYWRYVYILSLFCIHLFC